MLFVLVGQQLPTIPGNLNGYAPSEVLFCAALVYGTLVAARLGWSFSVPYLHPVFDRLLRARYPRVPWQERSASRRTLTSDPCVGLCLSKRPATR